MADGQGRTPDNFHKEGVNSLKDSKTLCYLGLSLTVYALVQRTGCPEES